jgi:hypothetical protein
MTWLAVDAPLYRNIREWVLVRVPLPEMPELGISAAGATGC